jgi:hypothetical protein
MTDYELIEMLDAVLALTDEDERSDAFFEFYEVFRQHPVYHENEELRNQIDAFAENLQRIEDEITTAHANYIMAEADLQRLITDLEKENPAFRRQLLYLCTQPDNEQYVYARQLVDIILEKEKRDGSFALKNWGIANDDDT